MDLSELYRSSFATFKATSLSARYSLGAFSLFLWRRRSVLYLTRRNIDDELGELGGIAGTFFHFKYQFNTTTTQKLAITIIINQPVI